MLIERMLCCIITTASIIVLLFVFSYGYRCLNIHKGIQALREDQQIMQHFPFLLFVTTQCVLNIRKGPVIAVRVSVRGLAVDQVEKQRTLSLRRAPSGLAPTHASPRLPCTAHG